MIHRRMPCRRETEKEKKLLWISLVSEVRASTTQSSHYNLHIELKRNYLTLQ